MQFKERLQDYTRTEFNQFVQAIWAVKVPGEEHDRMIMHFDRLVEHPQGADLLFYPDMSQMFDGRQGSDAVLSLIQTWYRQAGRQAFKEEAGPSSAGASDTRSRALLELERSHSMSAELEQQRQWLQKMLDVYSQLLDEAEQRLRDDTRLPVSRDGFDQAVQALDRLEDTRIELGKAVYAHENQGSSLGFSLRFLQKDYVRPAEKETHQASVQILEDANRRYQEQHTVFSERHETLHLRAEVVFARGQAQLVRRARLIRSGPLHDRQTFLAPLTGVDRHPRLLGLDVTRFDSYTSQWSGVAKAIRSAVAGVTWETPVPGEVQRASAVVFTDNRPGCGDPGALSVPLRDLMPVEGHDWHNLALLQAQANVPQRMGHAMLPLRHGQAWSGLREIKEQANVWVVRTDDDFVPARVRVRAAVRDEVMQGWRLDCPDGRQREVVWCSPVRWAQQLDAPPKPSRGGMFSIPRAPAVEKTDPAILQFDDYIVVFPEHSGIEPVYLTFKPRSEYPGMVTGQGQAVEADWLAASATAYPVPAQVVQRLQGQVFDRFGHLLVAFWKAVAAAPELCTSCSAQEREAMAQGQADPLAGRLRIDFIRHPQQGGDVYDLDNLRFVRL